MSIGYVMILDIIGALASHGQYQVPLLLLLTFGQESSWLLFVGISYETWQPIYRCGTTPGAGEVILRPQRPPPGRCPAPQASLG